MLGPAYHGPENIGAYKGIAAMAKNVGNHDRVIRIIAGLAIAAGAYVGGLPPVAIDVLYVVAAYLLLTGLAGWDLLYKLIDVDTTVQEQPYSTTDDRSGL